VRVGSFLVQPNFGFSFQKKILGASFLFLFVCVRNWKIVEKTSVRFSFFNFASVFWFNCKIPWAHFVLEQLPPLPPVVEPPTFWAQITNKLHTAWGA